MDAGQITVTIAEDGAVTLAGVNYRDLRSLFTAASLHYDGLKVVKPLDGLHDAALHENNLESVTWVRTMRFLLDVLDTKMAKAISPDYATGDLASIIRSFEYDSKNLEQLVKEEELRTTQPVPDPLEAIISSLTQSLAAANSALLEFKRARRKT